MRTVINVMEEEPPYHLYEGKPRPEIHWDTPSGQWVGIWGYEWPDQLGNHILGATDALAYEVWQPDTRAERIYSHEFPNGLLHKLFPAHIHRDRSSLGRRQSCLSRAMTDELERRLGSDLLVQFNSFRSPLVLDMIERLQASPVPLMITSHGSSLLPLEEMKGARHPATKLSLLLESLRWKRSMRRVDYLTDENQTQVQKLAQHLQREVGYLLMGCEFGFWVPKPPGAARLPAFEDLKRTGKTIFLSVGNFIPRKRFDRLIEVFSALEGTANGCLVLVGHGEAEYTNYLKRLGQGLADNGRLMFVDYVRDEGLRDIYWSSDIYVAAALSEGTSVAAEYAAGCSLPIISALNNGIGDLLTQLSCGLMLPPYSLDAWTEKFSYALSGVHLRPIPRHVAAEYYDWANVTQRYIDVYQRLFEDASRRKKTHWSSP